MTRLFIFGALALFLLGVPVAGADPVPRFAAGISPTPVQPPGTGTYAISIANQPNSVDATEALISIPGGFVVDDLFNPPQATTSGDCGLHSWTVTAGLTSIDAAAPDASAKLCEKNTLIVTFRVVVAPGDGSYEWTTQLSGPSGALVPQSQPTLVIDGTPPETTFTTPPPLTTNSSSSFAFSGSDSGSGVASFECDVGGGFVACTSPTLYNGLSEGSHTFQVRAVDTLGNRDPSPASATWTVD